MKSLILGNLLIEPDKTLEELYVEAQCCPFWEGSLGEFPASQQFYGSIKTAFLDLQGNVFILYLLIFQSQGKDCMNHVSFSLSFWKHMCYMSVLHHPAFILHELIIRQK